MPPERISAAGYAEFHPIATNETAEGRAENRRVDLVVLPRTRIDLSLPVVSRPAVSRSTDVWRKITDENLSHARIFQAGCPKACTVQGISCLFSQVLLGFFDVAALFSCVWEEKGGGVG